MSYTPTTIKEESYKGTICECYHCGERFGSANGTCSSLCKFCKTAEQREKIHEENRSVNPTYDCLVCKRVKQMKESKSQFEKKD